MAGDWIPYTKDLPHKPEVLRIAEETGRSHREVVAILLELWAWADAQTEDGFIPGVHVRSLSALHADTDADFWRSVCATGWLVDADDGLRVANFAAWMGRSAKRRLRESQRKRSSRPPKGEPCALLSASHADIVRTETGTTEQNSTEQNRNTKDPPTPRKRGSCARQDGTDQQSEAEPSQSKPPECLDTPEFRAAWERWLAHRRQRRCAAYKPIGQATQWKRLAELGPERAVAAIDFSIAQNYQGIYEERSAALPGAGGRLKQETLGDKIARLEAERRKAGEQ